MAKKTKSNNSELSILTRIKGQDLNITEPEKHASAASFSTWVRVLAQNWRQGTVGVKGRSDVSHTNRKPWKQKGTGRARAGSSRSPLWRGGGVIFGPQERVRTLKVSKKLRKKILVSLLFDYLKNSKITVLDRSIEGDKPKTALAYKLLQEAGLINKKVALFIKPDDVFSFASFSNLPMMNIFSFDQPNAFDLANSDHWVFFKNDFDNFKEMVSKWI